jgi:hypothetical protein
MGLGIALAFAWAGHRIDLPRGATGVIGSRIGGLH